MNNIAEQPASPVQEKIAQQLVEMSTADLAEAVELVAALRYTATTAGNLANWMSRETMEDFASSLVIEADNRLLAIHAEVRRRALDDDGDLDLHDVAVRLSGILFPRSAGPYPDDLDVTV